MYVVSGAVTEFKKQPTNPLSEYVAEFTRIRAAVVNPNFCKFGYSELN